MVNLCCNLKAVGVKYFDGGFAKFCSVPSSLVYKVKATLPTEIGNMVVRQPVLKVPLYKWFCILPFSGALIEPMSCLNQGWNRLKLNPKSIDSRNKVLVVGAGIIGLLWTALLHFKGLRNLWIAEMQEHRRNIAKGLSKFYRSKDSKDARMPCFLWSAVRFFYELVDNPLK